MGAQLASAHSALNMKLLVVLALTAIVLATTVLATVCTTARGRPRLPLRLRLTLTFCMVDMGLDMVILATATVLATRDTTGDKLPTPLQDLNHRRKTLTLFV